MEAAGVTCGPPLAGPRSSRRASGPPRLKPAPRLRLRRIRAGSIPGGNAQVVQQHGGGGSRTRVHERSIKSFYVRRSLNILDPGGQ